MLAVPFLNNYTDRFGGHSHEKQGVATGHDLDSNPSSGLMLRGHHELIRVYDFRIVPICFTNSLTGHQNTTEWRTQRQTCAHRVDRAERQEAAMASYSHEAVVIPSQASQFENSIFAQRVLRACGLAVVLPTDDKKSESCWRLSLQSSRSKQAANM